MARHKMSHSNNVGHYSVACYLDSNSRVKMGVLKPSNFQRV